MEIKRFEGTGRMSRVVEYNNTLYLCGQTAKLDGNTIEEQTAGVLKKVEDLLAKYGSDIQHVLSVTIYLRDMSLFQGMNSVWDSWVIDGYEPARATVEAKMASEEILVELSVIAAKR
ncbi:MAG: RidA family protein [Candidatus Izimaplasma sp.]|nr:RidA family protein [Candidatus Izimaplasma bacterium]